MIDKDSRIFRINKFDSALTNILHYRFWLIYTWQILRNEITIIFPEFLTSDDRYAFSIQDDETTRREFINLMNNEEYVLYVEQELRRLDEFIIAQERGVKEYITIIYDQLDEIVEPRLWDQWLPSLIDFWRTKRYSRIYGKLFIRKDLFQKLSGLSNIKDIENNAINIEWTQEEMFSFLFKIIFSNEIAPYYWALMYIYKDHSHILVTRFRNIYNHRTQIDLEPELLKPLVVTFFGAYVDTNKTSRMGESYDWFYKNLKNADDTISLRPFIDMIGLAIESWKKRKYTEEEDNKPILYQKYYTDRDVRLHSVTNHYEDLVRNEVGNMPIERIFDFISNSPKIAYKQISLKKIIFEEVLQNTVEKYSEDDCMRGHTINSLESLLITNGIVKKVNFGYGDIYKFAFLYKYKLGLKGV